MSQPSATIMSPVGTNERTRFDFLSQICRIASIMVINTPKSSTGTLIISSTVGVKSKNIAVGTSAWVVKLPIVKMNSINTNNARNRKKNNVIRLRL